MTGPANYWKEFVSGRGEVGMEDKVSNIPMEGCRLLKVCVGCLRFIFEEVWYMKLWKM